MWLRTVIISFILCTMSGCFLLHEQETSKPQVEHLSMLAKVDEHIDVVKLIGAPLDEALQHFGQPDDRGMSHYGYEWLLYKEPVRKYVQIGHEENRIVTVFILGTEVFRGPFAIGDDYRDIVKKITFKSAVTVQQKYGEYRFELNEEELKERPLLQLSDEAYAQLYFDRFTNKLAAVRVVDKDTLLKQRPYRLVYRGPLDDIEEKYASLLKEGEATNVKQIFEITNVLRERYGKRPLRWNEAVAKVAYHHSQDMKENEFFDHVSPTNRDLQHRLKRQKIKYSLAGENIAASYPDGIATVMGWLNSQEHRETLLHDKFTDIGIGVYAKHYTQNFITR